MGIKVESKPVTSGETSNRAPVVDKKKVGTPVAKPGTTGAARSSKGTAPSAARNAAKDGFVQAGKALATPKGIAGTGRFGQSAKVATPAQAAKATSKGAPSAKHIAWANKLIEHAQTKSASEAARFLAKQVVAMAIDYDKKGIIRDADDATVTA